MRLGTLVRSGAAIAVVALALTLALARPGSGSDDDVAAPKILNGYVFPGADPGRAVFAVVVSPRLARGAAAGTFFDPNVVYTIAVDNVGDAREHLVMQFKADGTGPLQRIEMYGPEVPQAAGTRSTLVPARGSATYNEAATLADDISIFAGPRRDPDFFDRRQFERIGAGTARCFARPGKAANAFATSSALAIVVEVPRTLIAPRKLGRIGVWWTASVADPGAAASYRQVSRFGRPLVAELVQSAAVRGASSRLSPSDDATFAADVGRFASAALPAGAGRSSGVAAALTAIFAPDELQADVQASGPAGYLRVETATPTPAPAASVRHVPGPYRPFGGRGLADPAAARTLAAFYGDAVPASLRAPDDGRETPCLAGDDTTPPPNPAASAFPYLDAPF